MSGGFCRTAQCLSAVAAVTVSVWGGAAIAGADPSSDPLPVPYAMGSPVGPDVAPPGANIPHCRSVHRPIVLVNGMNYTQSVLWSTGAPFLRNHGRCVFTFNDGNPAFRGLPLQQITDIRQSGQLLADEVGRVLAETGDRKVDLVSDSLGGMVANYYVNVMHGDAEVDRSIQITPANHGTTLNGVGPILSMLGPLVPALDQLATGSELVGEIYGRGDTRAGVIYTVIATEYDEIVTPWTHSLLAGPRVTNIVLQDGCPQDHTNHMVTAPHSPRTWHIVLNALDPGSATPTPCIPIN